MATDLQKDVKKALNFAKVSLKVIARNHWIDQQRYIESISYFTLPNHYFEFDLLAYGWREMSQPGVPE